VPNGWKLLVVYYFHLLVPSYQLLLRGLKEIKMVELYTKFVHPILKPINMDKTCPYLGDEVLERVKDNKRV
jgi:hypothetical protein